MGHGTQLWVCDVTTRTQKVLDSKSNAISQNNVTFVCSHTEFLKSICICTCNHTEFFRSTWRMSTKLLMASPHSPILQGIIQDTPNCKRFWKHNGEQFTSLYWDIQLLPTWSSRKKILIYNLVREHEHVIHSFRITGSCLPKWLLACYLTMCISYPFCWGVESIIILLESRTFSQCSWSSPVRLWVMS